MSDSTQTSKKLRVAELDFDRIKHNLKQFLKGKSEFSSFDFEASGISSLLDVLAYNTHYNAILANLISNEMFLDTAVKRSSVISHAKAMGYTPRSKIAAKATVNLVLNQASNNPNTVTLIAGTPFTTTIGSKTFQFAPIADYVASRSGDGKYYFGNVDLYQVQRFVIDFPYENDEDQRFIIPNKGIDLSKTKVLIQTSPSILEFTPYARTVEFLNIDEHSKVFFTQFTDEGEVEIYFGDNTFGKRPSHGNVVKIIYFVTQGFSGNGAKVFSLAGNIEGNTNINITTVTTSTGGANEETTEEIRFNAKSFFGSQNRAVTAEDYRAIILSDFTNVDSVITWGGESMSPPEYGRLYVSIEPKFGETITTTEETQIRNLLKDRSVGNTQLIFKNPEYIDLLVTSSIHYDVEKVVTNVQNIRTKAISEMISYGNQIKTFNGEFRYSIFTNKIDAANLAISHNETDVRMFYSWTPFIGTERGLTFIFNNKISTAQVAPAITSTNFYISGSSNAMRIRDNKAGRLMLVYTANNKENIYNDDIGRVNYVTGEITINPLVVTSYSGTEIRIIAVPQSRNIVSVHNKLLRLLSQNITITLVRNKAH